MRTIVDLPENQIDALKLLSEQEQISRAELVRRAIDEYLARHQQQPSSSLAFGLWRGRDVNALKYQQELRTQWDEREVHK